MRAIRKYLGYLWDRLLAPGPPSSQATVTQEKRTFWLLSGCLVVYLVLIWPLLILIAQDGGLPSSIIAGAIFSGLSGAVWLWIYRLCKQRWAMEPSEVNLPPPDIDQEWAAFWALGGVFTATVAGLWAHTFMSPYRYVDPLSLYAVGPVTVVWVLALFWWRRQLTKRGVVTPNA